MSVSERILLYLRSTIIDARNAIKAITGKHTIKHLVIATVITTLSVVQYILTLLHWTQPGLSLDDSWIHLQFARTIYEGTPWEYSPGYPSTGSTSPLWSVILSSLFFFTQDPIQLIWGVYFISSIFYVACTFLVGRLLWSYTQRDHVSIIGMVGFVMVPRNTWLMLSGMETPLFMFMLLLAIFLLERDGLRIDIVLGLVCGLAFLSRPEGFLLILVCVPLRFLTLLVQHKMNLRRLGSFLLLGVIAGLIILPWILYCLSVTGLPLPDTFYAKVHVPTEEDIATWNYWWNFFVLQMPHIAIGAIVGLVLVAKRAPYCWLLAVSLTILYRITLPYLSLINNARYLVPIFDLLMVAAIGGLAIIMERVIKHNLKVERALSIELLVGVVLILLLIIPITESYLYQADFYGNSVKNINEQQVVIGKWLYENTPEDAVLAIHDAGAIRFFSNRTVIDLAGLVSPDIIHGNMSSLQILIYLRDHGCEYFVFFNELMHRWLQLMPDAVTILYTVHLNDNVISGRDTMSVYYVNWTLVTIIY